MAYVSDTRASGLSLGQRIADFRAGLAQGAAKRKVYRTTVAELNMLSDRELTDLGIYRGDIPMIARKAAFGA